MPGAHGSHEFLELAAAILLSVGGGVFLVRAALDARSARRLAPVVAGDHAAGGPAALRATGPTAIEAVRRVETVVGAGLSSAAAAIHLAAGPGHVEALGDLGLGFFWAALFQGAFAIALLVHPGSIRLAWTGIVANLALIAVWAWSRTVGLPDVPGGAEPIGIADGTTVALQLMLTGLLAARLHGLDARLANARSASHVRSIATSSLVAVIGVIFVSTTIAIADAVDAHGHGPNEVHDHERPTPISDARGSPR